jgi:hypothetical protein
MSSLAALTRTREALADLTQTDRLEPAVRLLVDVALSF